MSKINILPAKVYNRIAAGEVVERPYSVVKELVENAIDAGATEIEIYVEQGGKQLVRVVDNGCGIERDDLHAAFLPHATSKISKAEDLNNVMTLGFRQRLYSPRFSTMDIDFLIVLGDAPIRTYHSFIFICIDQQILNDVPAVAVGDVLS